MSSHGAVYPWIMNPMLVAVLVGICTLIVLLVVIFTLAWRRNKRARQAWSTALPTWGSFYRDALTHKAAHARRLPRGVSRSQAEPDLFAQAERLARKQSDRDDQDSKAIQE